MKKQTQINNLSLEKVCGNLETIAKSEAIINNCKNIEYDMGIDLRGDNFCGWLQHSYGEYYFAIREGGGESSGHIEVVKERCRILGQPTLTIQLKRLGDDTFTMTINR